MLQQSGGLLFHKLRHHVAQYSSHGIESLVCRADVVESMIIEQDLLDNKDSDGLAQLRSRLHDAQAQRDDFCGQKEVDHIG